MSGLDANYIWNKLSLARGLQYLTLWYWRHGFVCYPVKDKTESLMV